MKLIFLMVVILGFSVIGLSQRNDQGAYGSNREGRLDVNQDQRLDELIRRQVVINEKRDGIPGFRIRIFSQSGQSARQNAEMTRASFFNNYPDIETYIRYDAPIWKVYVGDFRTRSEALRMQRRFGNAYPNSFIVNMVIQLPPLD